MLEALKRLTDEAVTASPRRGGPTLRYLAFDGLHLVAVRNEITKSLDLVIHYDRATTPTFVSCEEDGDSVTELEYSCRVNGRCTASPCSTEGWSVPVAARFDRASFASSESADALSILKFSGRASKLGEGAGRGTLRINMEFEDSDLTALDFTKESRLRLKMLLGDGDGTELATFGTEVALQEPLPVARGARADRATFKYEGRNSALARATVVRRGGRLKVSLKVGKATLGVPAACQAGAGHTFLTTAVSLESGVTGVSDLGLSTTQLWRCLPSGDGSFNLRVENKGSRSGGGGSGGGNRRPQAKIDVENSTRTPDTPNWFELSAERSSDRDGEIRSYAFAVERRRRTPIALVHRPVRRRRHGCACRPVDTKSL